MKILNLYAEIDPKTKKGRKISEQEYLIKK